MLKRLALILSPTAMLAAASALAEPVSNSDVPARTSPAEIAPPPADEIVVTGRRTSTTKSFEKAAFSSPRGSRK